MRSRTRAVDLLKVGHHGSRGSTGDEWLDSLRPRAAVISVGQNKYGHPSPPTLAPAATPSGGCLADRSRWAVTVTTDGTEMTLQSKGRSTTYDVR